MQPSAIFGVFGLSAIVISFILGLSLQIINKKINFIWFSFFVLILIFSIFWYFHRDEGKTIKSGLVQVKIKELERFIYGEDFESLKGAMDFVENSKERVDFFVLPESLFISNFELKDKNFKRLVNFSHKIPFVLNTNFDEMGKSYNSVLYLKDGEIKKVYKKIHLVPFGEYLPLRNFFERFGFKKIARSLYDFDRGKEVGYFPYADGFGVSICYEIIFPYISLKEVKEGASFLIVLTNDSWYGDSLGPRQHFRLAQIRAVELHRPILRSALTGISGGFDSHGRLLNKMDLGKEGILYCDIKNSRTLTPYYYLREYPIFILLVFFIFLEYNKKRKEKL